MRRHAIRGKEHLTPGGDTNLARATYAAYNGGPGHLRRYRKPTTSARLRAVDTEFWQKYQAVEKRQRRGVLLVRGEGLIGRTAPRRSDAGA